MHSDRAIVRKKLFRVLKTLKMMRERELRGEKDALRLSFIEFLDFVENMLDTSSKCDNSGKIRSQLTRDAIEEAGGRAAWDKLRNEEPQSKNVTQLCHLLS